MATMVSCSEIRSPVGRLLLAELRDGAVVRIAFAGGRTERRQFELAVSRSLADETGMAPDAEVTWQEPRGSRLRRQLQRYFEGRLREFDLELLVTGTPFQQKVWDRLCRIPYGRTLSYAELARAVGRPTAVRAVARANARNPIPVVVPCHRVIGSNGSLTGYGGGIDRKRTLLELEGARVLDGGFLPWSAAP